jgi:predicted CoA-substrate-specific enzyme activase
MTWYMGIDIGSGTSKGVITMNGKRVAYHIIPSGVNYSRSGEKVREDLLTQTGLRSEDVAFTIVTGQGAGCLAFGDEKAADIRCCARGINRLFPAVGIVIDVQGQSSQVIKVGAAGQVIDFAVSEKCAAGSGRFLDVIANVLQIEMKDFPAISLRSKNPVAFATGCAVFGESEAISRVAEGALIEDILAGVLQALAGKITALVERVGLEGQVAICGGGALNSALVQKVEENLGVRLLVAAEPQMVNALGAAVIAEEKFEQFSQSH